MRFFFERLVVKIESLEKDVKAGGGFDFGCCGDS